MTRLSSFQRRAQVSQQLILCKLVEEERKKRAVSRFKRLPAVSAPISVLNFVSSSSGPGNRTRGMRLDLCRLDYLSSDAESHLNSLTAFTAAPCTPVYFIGQYGV